MNAGVGLARVADAEVDHLDPAAARLGAPVVEARERVLLELGEERRELHRLDATEQEPLQRVVRPRELGDLDLLVGRVRVARRARARG